MISIAKRMLCAAGLAGACTPVAWTGEDWATIRTSHFVFVSEANRVTTGEAARNLERFHAALLAALPETKPSHREVVVYVLRSSRSFRAHASPRDRGKAKRVSGQFRPRLEREILLVDASDLRASEHIARHEYAHAVLSAWGRPSLWLTEGLADYFAYFVASENRATLGDLSRPHRMYLAKESEGSVKDLVAVESYPDDAEENSEFYLRSLVLVHALIHGTDRGIPGILDLVERLDRGDGIEDALSAVYGFGIDGLQKTYDAYRNRIDHWPTTAVPFAMPAEAKSVRFEPLTGPELDARLGDLYRSSGDDGAALARERYRRALKRDPVHPRALAGLIHVEGSEGRRAEAEKRCSDARAARVTAPEVAWACADVLLDDPCRHGPAELRARYREARLWLGAVEINPVYEEIAGVARGITLLAEATGADEAARLLGPENDDDPSDGMILAARLVIAARRGDTASGTALAGKLGEEEDAEAMREWIRCLADALEDPEEAARIRELAAVSAPRSSPAAPAPPPP